MNICINITITYYYLFLANYFTITSHVNPYNLRSSNNYRPIYSRINIPMGGLGGVVGLTLPMARADRGSRPVYYLPCSDLGQVVNLSFPVRPLAVNSTP